MSRATRLIILYSLEAVAALLALVIFLAALVLWRLAEGPVQAEILRQNATEALLVATQSDIASIGAIEVSFSPRLAAVVVTARDVTAAREGGDIVLNAKSIQAGLALDLLLVGRAAPVSLAVDGGKVSVLRTMNGDLRVGLGRIEALRANDQSIESERSNPLVDIRTRSETAFSRLREVELRGVELRLVDDITDFDTRVRDATASVSRGDDGIEADIEATLLSSAGLAPVAARLVSGPDLQSVFLDLRIEDLVPAAIAPRRGHAALLGSLDAPIRLELVLDASVEDGLRSALLEIAAAPGVLRLDEREFNVRPSALSVLLDTADGEAVIETARIDTDLIDLNLSGRFFDFSNFQDALPSFLRFELEVQNGFVDLGGVFPDPPAWQSIVTNGFFDRTERAVDFETLDMQLDNARGRFEGRVWLSEYEERWLPNLELAGPVEGRIVKSDVLALWPVGFALGARDWVRDSILDGELSGASLSVAIPASAIAAGALSNDHLRLSFDFRDADVRYMSTMTPLYGLSGSAVLYGDSLSLTGSGGTIGALTADQIFVEIPRFNPKGATARFGGEGRGPVQDLLRLVDEPPLEVPTDYGLDPDAFGGEGEFSFEIQRPMLRSVPPEDMGYEVTGRFENVVAPTGFNDANLENGVVEISISPEGFFANAEAELANTPAQLKWVETFGLDEDEPSSAVELSAVMSGRALDRLGFPVRRFFDGSVGVEAVVRGRGMDFSSVDATLDLVDAAVALPANIWDKSAGEPATARFVSGLSDTGGFRLDRAEIAGAGIDAALSAELAADGRLLSAEISKLKVDGAMDLSASASRPDGPDGRLSLQLDANYLDLGDGFSFGGGGNGFDFVTAPVDVEAVLDRVFLRGVAFEDVDMNASAGPEGLISAEVRADAQAGPLSLLFYEDPNSEDGQRRLDIDTADAGSVLMALTGFDNVSGGELRLRGTVPAVDRDAPSTGQVELGPFRLERMPLLARILAAGSFDGLARLLSGEQGVEFEQLESQYSWQSGRLRMQNSRLAGPSLGITWAGEVDLGEQNTDIEGTILPSYGVNSVLGAIPVLGELLTSRRGEGIFGITYSAQGPFDETRITVNPLSAFAPGVFRRIFEGTSSADELDAIEAEIERSNPTDPEPEASEPEPESSADTESDESPAERLE